MKSAVYTMYMASDHDPGSSHALLSRVVEKHVQLMQLYLRNT